MQNDTRDRNKTFSLDTPGNYLKGYSDNLHRALSLVDQGALSLAVSVLNYARANKRRIFVCGNGGSASIANHLCCDFQKGCHVKSQPNLLVHSLSSNMSIFSAIANDLEYSKVFSYQLELHDVSSAEVLIAISSSGNSLNIVDAVHYAKTKSMNVIGLTGFNGGRLQTACDVSLHVNADNYGVIEDAHQSLMHVLAQYMYLTSR